MTALRPAIHEVSQPRASSNVYTNKASAGRKLVGSSARYSTSSPAKSSADHATECRCISHGCSGYRR
jgi:hypothetical protein